MVVSPPFPEPLSINTLDWKEISQRVNRLWVPDQAPHHSIISQTGGGKSYLVTRGLLSMCQYDKVLIIDNKGDDPTLRGFGEEVLKIPRFGWSFRGQKPGDQWFRLLVHEDREKAREQVKKALEHVWKDQDWIVVIDELKALTDPRDPALGLGPLVEQMWLRGRSKKVSLIACTQSPQWIPSSFKTQPAFIWMSRIEDEDAQVRLRQICGLSKAHLPIVTSLKKHVFLYTDYQEDDKFTALTKVD